MRVIVLPLVACAVTLAVSSGSAEGLLSLGGMASVSHHGNVFVTWDGRNWNVPDERAFSARFETYLATPPASPERTDEYQLALHGIMEKLSPGKNAARALDEALGLLAKASKYPDDAKLCECIANQVYSTRLARKVRANLVAARISLEAERIRLEWNAELTVQGGRDYLESHSNTSPESQPREGWDSTFEHDQEVFGRRVQDSLRQSGRKDSPENRADETQMPMQSQKSAREIETQQIRARLAETDALIKVIQVKTEITELQAKIQFQALIVQCFLQRRFQHTIVGIRFYRNLFNDEDKLLRLSEETRSQFSKMSGQPPTVDTVESLSSEILHDVRESIKVVKFLQKNNENRSATRRLQEAFLIGEYLPEVRLLRYEDKRRALAFLQRSEKLNAAIEVGDHDRARSLVIELSKTAADFDGTRAMAAIETARQGSALHIAKARNAAVNSDWKIVDKELEDARKMWPFNPELKESFETFFSRAAP